MNTDGNAVSPHRIRQLAIYGTALMLAVASSAVFGVTAWLPVAFAALTWFLALRERWDAMLAALMALAGTLAVLLLALVVSAGVGGSVHAAVLVVSAAGGAFGLALVRPGKAKPSWGKRVLSVSPSALGAAVWVGTVAFAKWFPGGAHFAWAMNGDAANNVLFVRIVLKDGGITLGGGENPVPLPPALVAVTAATDRVGVGPENLLAHDVSALVVTWTGLIAVLCVLAGLVARELVPTRYRVQRLSATAAASLIPLTWYIVGYPIEYGFLNTHVILVVLLLSWLAYLRAPSSPAIALGLQAIAGILALASWGPLVIFPGLLGVAILVVHGRSVLRAGPRALSIPAVSIALFFAYALVATLPAFLHQSGFAATAGGVFPISRWTLPLLVSGLLVAVAAVAFLRRRSERPSHLIAGGVALATAAAGGWAILLVAARTTPDPWVSYYPAKYAWLAGVVLFIAGTGIAAGLVSVARSASLRTAGIVTLAAGVAVAAAWLPATRTGYVQTNPVVRVVTGDFWPGGDDVAYRIFANANIESPTLEWATEDPSEGLINFWTMQIQSDWPTDDVSLNVAAYGVLVGLDSVEELCRIIPLMNAPTTVRTADPDLTAALEDECPNVDAEVEVLR